MRRSHLAQIAINFWALRKWPKWPQSAAKLVTFSATLHILAGPKLKVKCELELPTAARATTTKKQQQQHEKMSILGDL